MDEKSNVNEDIELDNFMNSLNKEEIPVPEDLEDKINKRIDTLKPAKGSLGRKILAVCAAFSFLFVGAVKISPDFAAYASNVPGLENAVEWLRGDKGIINAQEHGYTAMEPIILEEDGYILHLDNIFLDEDRIRLSAVISGEKLAEYFPENPEQEKREGVVDEEFWDEHLHQRPDVSIRFIDFKNPGATQESYDGNIFTLVTEKVFEPGEVQEFLQNSPEYLNVIVDISKGQEMIHKFSAIKIPINSDIFKPSQIYKQNKVISLEHTDIIIKKLSISPTRMHLDINFNMEDGYIFTGFENPRLLDEKANTYKSEGLVSTNSTDTERILYFVPSTYFDKPQKLYFCFDGIRIGSKEGQEFTLNLNDEYPKKIEYMGEDIIIEKVDILQKREKTKLCIETKLPPKNILRIQSLDIIGYDGPKSWGSIVHEDETGNKIVESINSSFFIEKREQYKVEFDYPGYLIKADTKCLLNIK